MTSTASSGGRAIQGTSNTGQGVYGYSSQNAGVVGESLNLDGVYGSSSSSTHAAVSAHNDVWGGFGLWAIGGDRANHTAAIHGQSAKGNAIEGFSTANPASGVYGQDNNANSYGVAGHSDNGVAVVGDSASGWAMQALGHATQSRTTSRASSRRWPTSYPAKTDKIRRCFNSQLPANQATVPLCGITLSNPSEGIWNVDFGFYVGDRFALASSNNINANVGVGVSGNAVTVRGWDISNDRAANVPFFVVVF